MARNYNLKQVRAELLEIKQNHEILKEELRILENIYLGELPKITIDCYACNGSGKGDYLWGCNVCYGTGKIGFLLN